MKNWAKSKKAKVLKNKIVIKGLLIEVKNILDTITNTSGTILVKKYSESYINGKKITSGIPCYVLTYSGIHTLKKLYMYLYAENKNSIFLHRKRQKIFNATLTSSELEDLKIL